MDCFRESPLQHFKAVYRPYTEYAGHSKPGKRTNSSLRKRSSERTGLENPPTRLSKHPVARSSGRFGKTLSNKTKKYTSTKSETNGNFRHNGDFRHTLYYQPNTRHEPNYHHTTMKESVICFKFLLIVLLSLLPTAKVKAAPSGEPLISLEVANASLQKLLPLLEEQAGVTFTYESSLLKNMPQINISFY